ncbi:MAG TPA: manganese efflux pump MntP family protein [Bacteroidota bacterium]|nr:manganese efflux pump MntP family protein [Bacteroidota bacterium]
MSIFEILIIAFGLAADAFAVSIGAGVSGILEERRSMIRLSFHFGLFQFLMPVLGWLAGTEVAQWMEAYNHWIAFILLTWVGARMIQSGLKNESLHQGRDPSRGILLVILSLATSIDALAVGFSLALLNISIWYPAVVIGIITGGTSFLGILLGQKLSGRIGRTASIIGGILLIFIGGQIVVSHIFH